MTKTVQYTGSSQLSYDSVLGRQWEPGETHHVDDAAATALVATGNFSDVTSANDTFKKFPTFGADGIYPSVYFIGDSITNFCYSLSGATPANTLQNTSRSWIDKGLAMAYQPAKVLGVYGLPGALLTGDIKNLFEQKALSNKPGLVVIEGGSNDFDNGISAAAVWAAIYWMYQKAIAIGTQVLYVGTAGMTRNFSNSESHFYELEKICFEAAKKLRGFYFCPMANAMRDYGATSSQTTQGKTIVSPVNASYDDTHPAPYGATLMALPISTSLRQIFPGSVYSRIGINNYQSGANNVCSDMMLNSLMSGSSGSVTAPNTGTSPDNMELTQSGSISAVSSMVARTDGGPGRWWNLAISGAAAASDAITAGIGWTAPGGDGANTAALIGLPVCGRIEVNTSVTSGYITSIRGELRIHSAGGATLYTAVFNEFYNAGEYDCITSFAGVLSTPTFTMPAGANNASFYVTIQTSVGASVTVKLTGMSVPVDTTTSII